MANTFQPQQRLSQDEAGKTLILVDFSNYNGITPVPEDPYVNSSGNDDDIDITDFVSRKWILVDIDGNIEEVIFPYSLTQINRCSIFIDKDKYLSITMVTETSTKTYTSLIETGLYRQAEFKLYVESLEKKPSDKKCGCNSKSDQYKIDATNFIQSAIFKVRHYDNAGYTEDINAANKLLDSIITWKP